MPEKMRSPRPPPPTRKASGATPTLITSATRTPWAMIGSASGSSTSSSVCDGVMPMPRAHSSSAGGSWRNPSTVLRTIGSSGVQEERDQRRRFPDTERHHGERDDRERRDRRDDAQDLHHRLADPAQRPPGERDAEEHAHDDGGSARIENEQDVLARQMHHLALVLEGSRRRRPTRSLPRTECQSPRPMTAIAHGFAGQLTGRPPPAARLPSSRLRISARRTIPARLPSALKQGSASKLPSTRIDKRGARGRRAASRCGTPRGNARLHGSTTSAQRRRRSRFNARSRPMKLSMKGSLGSRRARRPAFHAARCDPA